MGELYSLLNKSRDGATLNRTLNTAASAKVLHMPSLLSELDRDLKDQDIEHESGRAEEGKNVQADSKPAKKKLNRLKLHKLKDKKQAAATAAGMKVNRDFPWHLQVQPMEIFGSHERDLSARGDAHRTTAYWKKEIKRHTNTLSIGGARLTRPEAFKSHFCRAFAEARLGHDDCAFSDYSAAIQAMPTNGAAYFNRSAIHCRLGRFESAIEDLGVAIERDPSHRAEYYGNRALLHRKLGNFAEAMNDYELSEYQRELRANRRRTFRRANTRSMNSAEQYQILAELGKAKDGTKLAACLQSNPETRSKAYIDEICDSLREQVLFKSLPEEILRGLSKMAKYVKVRSGHYVFNEGDIGNSMYVILAGEVTVRKSKVESPTNKSFRRRPAGIEEDMPSSGESILQELQDFIRKAPVNEIILANLGPGVSFGEIGDDAPPPSSEEETDESLVHKLKVMASTNKDKPNISIGDSEEAPSNYGSEDVDEADLLSDLASSDISSASASMKFKRRETTRQMRRRKASIYAEEDTELLMFETSPSANKILNMYRSWQVDHRVQSFRKSNIFAHWSDEDLEKLAKKAMMQQFASGSVLIEQRGAVDDLYFILCGVCRLSRKTNVAKPAEPSGHPARASSYTAILEDIEDDIHEPFSRYGAKPTPAKRAELREFEVGVIGCGQVAGEFAVLENHLQMPSPVTVTAMTTVDVLVITREELSDIMPCFYGESMVKIRENLRVNCMPHNIIRAKYADNRNWEREKRRLVLSSVTMNNRLRRVQQELEASEREVNQASR